MKKIAQSFLGLWAVGQFACGGNTPATKKSPDRTPAAAASSVATSEEAAPAKRPVAPAHARLTAPWSGPFGGVPPFGDVAANQFEAAFEQALAEHDREIAHIATSAEPATFANTLEALELAGTTLARVNAVFGVWASNLSTPEILAIDERISPKLAAHYDRIVQNRSLWQRIETVYAAKASLPTAEQQRLAWYYYNQFASAGAKLDDAGKTQLSAYNQTLATLYSKFSKNLLADEAVTLRVDSEAELAGVPASLVASAAALAQSKGSPGKWMFANTRSAMEPLLTYATNRGLREKAFRMFTSRGDNGDGNDNNAIAAEILRTRAKKAKLLGQPTYAHLHLLDTMAQKPAATQALMLQVWKPAVAAVGRDVAAMQKIIDGEKGGFALAPWDYRFYAEKLRVAKFDLDMEQVKPYLQVENLREAMFFVANQIYGLSFHQTTAVPGFHPDVRVYEVRDRANKTVGLWYFDPYAREGKRSGAWMTAYRDQQRLAGDIITLVSNNSNFIKPVGKQPAVISWTDAETMFHEFGHALHGLNSKVTYPSLSGTNTMRDHVEFPSQVNEGWLLAPVVLEKFLKNAAGEAMPKPLIDKLKRATTFGTGFATVEALASAIVDMELHLAGDVAIDTKAFEAKTLANIGMPKQIVMRHRIPQFGHVFSGDGYAAGYYGYIWAEVLARDAFEAFVETGNWFEPAVAKRLHDHVMSVGNTIDSMEGYKLFRGRAPKVDALLRDRGFKK